MAIRPSDCLSDLKESWIEQISRSSFLKLFTISFIFMGVSLFIIYQLF